MPDRGRDVVLRVVSDESKFDLSDVVAELEDVSKESDDAARDLEKTTDELKRLAAQGKDAQRQLDALNREVADNEFDRFGRDAKETARKVDDAFDDIARSSRHGMDDVNKNLKHGADEGLSEFKDEARQSGRESAASFSGGFDDVTDLVQEVAANAFVGFGPGGEILGLALAAGVGIATALWGKSKEEAEALEEKAQDVLDSLIAGAGKLDAAAVDEKIKGLFGDKETRKQMEDFATAAERAGVNVRTFIRAYAGDPAAVEEATKAIQGASAALDENTQLAKTAPTVYGKQRDAVNQLAEGLGIATEATDKGRQAYDLMRESLAPPIEAVTELDMPTAQQMNIAAQELRKGVGQPIPVNVFVRPPPPHGPNSSANAVEHAISSGQSYANTHPITLRYKSGQRPVRDVGP